METKLGLDTTLRQTQTLAPLQMQYVRLLEMSGTEVEEHVREAVNENPALEVADESPTELHEEQFTETAEEMQRADYGSDDDVPSGGAYDADRDVNGSSSDRYIEPMAADRGDTLMEALMRQLRETDFPEEDIPLAEYIIGSIDDNGYMTRTVERVADDLAMVAGIDVPVSRLTPVWDAIRALEPAGVGAVDLRDCMLLQLQRRKQASTKSSPELDTAITMIADHFELFSRKHYDRLCSVLGIDDEDIKRVMKVIRSLNPKPGTLISGGGDDDRARQITPDFVVEHDPDSGRFTLTLPNSIPRLQISSSFVVDAPREGKGAGEANLFIRQRRDEASTFIQALSLRQQTLHNVMWAIIKLQSEFFTSGDATRLKPMVLKDVAALTGYDLSVISRATSGKYVDTGRRIYPLRFFFSERPNENTDVSTHQIDDALSRIIKEEDPKAPLSDAAITERLREQGFDLARRTVAKYRERLGYPVGRLRKKI